MRSMKYRVADFLRYVNRIIYAAKSDYAKAYRVGTDGSYMDATRSYGQNLSSALPIHYFRYILNLLIN